MLKKYPKYIWIIYLFVFFQGSLAQEREKVIPVSASSKKAKAHYRLALEASYHVNIDEAIENLKKAIGIDPAFVMAYAQYATFLSAPENQRMIDEAKNYFSEASDGERRFVLAMEAFIKNDRTTERRILEELKTKYPDDDTIYLRLTLSYYLDKMYCDAVENGKMAVACDSTHYRATNLLGYSYLQVGRFDEAILWLKKYAEHVPEKANPWDSLGDAYKNAGQYYQARQYYEKALEIDPNFTASLMHLGDIQHELGYYEEAESYYQDGLRSLLLRKEISDSHYRAADAFWRLRLVNNYIVMGEFDKAEKEIRTILKHDSPAHSVCAHYLAAESALKRGDTQSVKREAACIQKLLKQNNLSDHEKDQIYHVIHAKITLVENDFVSAEQYAHAAVNAFTEPGHSNMLSWIYPMGNDDNTCVAPLNLLVDIFRKQQRLDDETRTIKRSLEIIPQQPALLYRLGEIYVEQKKKEEALKAFQEFLRLVLVNDFQWPEDELLKAGKFIADYYGYRLISGEALLEKIQKSAKYTLIDCRPPEEYAAGYIPGAVNISIDSYGFGEKTPIKASMNKIIHQVGREMDFILIDTESGEEYMPRTKLLELLNVLPEDREEDVILYCRKPSCTRSRLAARWLVLLGFKNVYRYAGSWKDWSDKKYPFEK